MLILCFLIGIFVALKCPDTVPGRLTKRIFVEAPGRWLANMTTARMIAGIAVLIIFSGLVMAFSPEVLMIMAADITAYMEIVVAIGLMVSQLRIRQSLRGLRLVYGRFAMTSVAAVGRIRTVARAVQIRPSILRKDAEDEDPAAILAFA